ncbi:MAG: putative CoA-transferase [Frankiales bacterium]|jgi:crotonobetainyl-CoA:carnitine CoA-transferase CaiB-like acyl-CoA transferase|nr:putative CoA-transferase [Frankiales bacterium]
MTGGQSGTADRAGTVTAIGRPLEGVRVVEVAGWMAAPGAAAMMCDLGAEVVKVEPLRGDPMRGVVRRADLEDFDPPFQMDNRGKRGIALALDRPEGQELVRRLADGADVFLNNLLGRRQHKFGLDADTLLARNPRLVHGTLTGYGLDGPDSARPGFDITAFFGRGGITQAITEPGSQAPRARPAQGDHAAALAMLAAVLTALRLVERTGRGQVIDVNLLATASWTMASDLSSTLVDGQDPPMLGRRGRRHALQESFRTQDDRWVLLFMPEPHWWPKFCSAVGHPEWAEDPRFETVATRFENMPVITDLMDELFASRPLAEWASLFDEAGFTWAPAATLSEVAADPHAAAVGTFPEIEHPVRGTFRTVALPMTLRGQDLSPRGPAPELGQHTREVLAELDLSPEEIDRLVAEGTVADGS